MANNITSGAVGCEIRSVKSSGDTILEAVATAHENFTGEYNLTVSKSGGGGTSEIAQGGDFEIIPGEQSLLGEVAVNSQDGTSVQATLTLTKAGKLLCKAQLASHR